MLKYTACLFFCMACITHLNGQTVLRGDSLTIQKHWKDASGENELRVLVMHPLIKEFLPGAYSTVVIVKQNITSKRIVRYQDTCNWQMGQYLWYDSALVVKDMDGDGMNEVRCLFKVAGMDNEDNTIQYLLIYKNEKILIPLHIASNGVTGGYKLSSDIFYFKNQLPDVLKGVAESEYAALNVILARQKPL